MAGWYRKRWIKRLLKIIVITLVLAVAWYFLRIELRPSIPGPSDRALAHAKPALKMPWRFCPNTMAG